MAKRNITDPTTAVVFGKVPLNEDLYTAGQVETRLTQASTGIKTEINQTIATKLSTVWKAGGSKTAEQLTTALLVAANEGYVYNLTTDATTDGNWVEGSDKEILAGTDVAVINAGTAETPSYKFNALAPRDASVIKEIETDDGSGSAVTPVFGQIQLIGGTAGISTHASSGFEGTVAIDLDATVNGKAFKDNCGAVILTGQDVLDLDTASGLSFDSSGKLTVHLDASMISISLDDGCTSTVFNEIGSLRYKLANLNFVSSFNGVNCSSIVVAGGFGTSIPFVSSTEGCSVWQVNLNLDVNGIDPVYDGVDTKAHITLDGNDILLDAKASGSSSLTDVILSRTSKTMLMTALRSVANDTDAPVAEYNPSTGTFGFFGSDSAFTQVEPTLYGLISALKGVANRSENSADDSVDIA